jgi:hypothetical protein
VPGSLRASATLGVGEHAVKPSVNRARTRPINLPSRWRAMAPVPALGPAVASEASGADKERIVRPTPKSTSGTSAPSWLPVIATRSAYNSAGQVGRTRSQNSGTPRNRRTVGLRSWLFTPPSWRQQSLSERQRDGRRPPSDSQSPEQGGAFPKTGSVTCAAALVDLPFSLFSIWHPYLPRAPLVIEPGPVHPAWLIPAPIGWTIQSYQAQLSTTAVKASLQETAPEHCGPADRAAEGALGLLGQSPSCGRRR